MSLPTRDRRVASGALNQPVLQAAPHTLATRGLSSLQLLSPHSPPSSTLDAPLYNPDDLGYGLPGWGGDAGGPFVPALDALRASGLTLTNTLVYQFCSPSRGSFLTG